MARYIFAIFLALSAIAPAFSQSPQHPQPQIKNSNLGTNNGTNQPTPPKNFPTMQEIEQAISNGIESAQEKYDANHPAMPPNNSAWWFNALLVSFTGLLVVVGGINCLLIFWTLKATTTAANAAKESAKVAERSLVAVERPILIINIPEYVAITAEERKIFTTKLKFTLHVENVGKQLATLHSGSAVFIVKKEARPPLLSYVYPQDGTDCPLGWIGELVIKPKNILGFPPC
jgi:hypothetical protein